MLAQKLNDFLVAVAPDRYCDLCLAIEVRASEPTNHVTAALGALHSFVQEMGDCSECGERRVVINAVLAA